MGFAKILFNQVFIMFLLLAIGYFLFKIRFITADAANQITKIVLHVVTPAVILNTYQMDYDPALARNLLLGFGLSAAAILIAILISNFARIGAGRTLCIERFAVIFSNCGFMAIPLVSAIFGELGVFYTNTYITVYQVVVWTYGVMLMTGSDPHSDQSSGEAVSRKLLTLGKRFLTPTMISILIGLICYFFRIKFPAPVKTTTEYIASMNTPLAMLVSGMYLAQNNLLDSLKNFRAYYIVLLKCFVVPLAVLALFYFLPFDDTLLTTLLITSACPSASNCLLFAALYKQDIKTASNAFTLTTLFSIISIPLVILIKGLLF